MFAQLKNLAGDQLVAAFKPLLAPPDLASRLPGDAAAYARISAAPQALWRELTRAAGADAVRLRDRIQETTGLDLEKDLIPSFAGNVGIAGFGVPGQQDLWVDIAGIVRSVERAAGAQGGIAGQGARLFAERAADLRDLLFEMRPGKEGVDADLWLRFLPPKKSATK